MKVAFREIGKVHPATWVVVADGAPVLDGPLHIAFKKQ
jgi:hypothetical protein